MVTKIVPITLVLRRLEYFSKDKSRILFAPAGPTAALLISTFRPSSPTIAETASAKDGNEATFKTSETEIRQNIEYI